jgi:hypothetical protein
VDFCAGDEFGALNDSHNEAGEVVFAVGVEAGHLRGFAADEGAAVGAACIGQAGDDLLRNFAVEAASGEVVEEEERGCALDGDVVDAVVDEVGADGVMDAELEGELELGADAVGRGDQDWLLVFAVETEEAAEAADLAEHVAGEGALGEVLDALFGAIAGGDVDAGVGVGGRGGGGFPLRRGVGIRSGHCRNQIS